jgi:oligopeptide transport system permease protein
VLLFVGIGCLEWLTTASCEARRSSRREFIEAARAGEGHCHHHAPHRPNLTGPVVIYATLTIPEIITESFLSTGLGCRNRRHRWAR